MHLECFMLHDGRGHEHTYVTTFTIFTQHYFIGSLVTLYGYACWALNLAVLCQKKVVDSHKRGTMTEMPDFFFCLIYGGK